VIAMGGGLTGGVLTIGIFTALNGISWRWHRWGGGGNILWSLWVDIVLASTI